MAASKPVVATDVGGVGQVVLDGETGKLIPSRNVGSLAEALEMLISDSNMRRRLGSNGHCFVEKNFSMNNMVKLYMELYKI
jgi:glycosyltransferase involved in cell wall biosynthesis